MKTNHTPGPWQKKFVAGCFRITSAASAAVYAPAIATVHMDSGPGEKLKSAPANARLIAAAPETAAERDRLKAVNAELLAALEHLLDEVSAGSKSLDFNNGKKAARAAIAKARGKS